MKKINSLAKKVHKKYADISLHQKDNILFLDGKVSTYEQKLEIGFYVSKHHYFSHIVNNIEVTSLEKEKIKVPSLNDNFLEKKQVDVLIIGAGVIGCAIARELSKYSLSVLLIDKEEDVGMHATSRNDGNVHVGIDLHKNTKKLHYLKQSVGSFENLCKELDVDFKRTGQGIALTEKKLLPLIRLYLPLKAKINGIPNVKVYGKKKIHQFEPGLGDNVIGGAIFHSEGQVNPYQFTIALCENAMDNGVEVSLSTYCRAMRVRNHVIESVDTNRGRIYPKVVINAAGCFSEDIAKMAEDQFFSIHPRKGTDAILDKKCFKLLSRSALSVYHLGSAGGKTHSKGGGVVPTVDNNTLVGPDAIEVPYKEDFSVSMSSLNKIISKQQEVYKDLKMRDIITYFAGIRACTYEEDFIVEKGRWTKNIVHAAGIQSPGLTCAPSIAKDITKFAIDILKTKIDKKQKWIIKHHSIVRVNRLSDKERDELIKKNPDYGIIVCRCEEISKGEILDSLKSTLPATTIDGVKRRVRAGMGRCQGGFCQGMILNMMSEYYAIKPEEVKKKGDGYILTSDIKGE